MAWWYVPAVDECKILRRQINGMTLIDWLDFAVDVPNSREDSSLVYYGLGDRGVNFGFFDSVIHTGDLLFSAVLKYRAAHELAELHRMLGNGGKAAEYKQITDRARRGIAPAFLRKAGLLRATTGESCQPDVWGSSFAIYVGALEEDLEGTVSCGLAEAYRDGRITWRGNIRHTPTDADHRETTA